MHINVIFSGFIYTCMYIYIYIYISECLYFLFVCVASSCSSKIGLALKRSIVWSFIDVFLIVLRLKNRQKDEFNDALAHDSKRLFSGANLFHYTN